MRCRFVQPSVVRLYLVDVHKRALRELTDLLASGKVPKKELKAKQDELATLPDKIAEAEADGAYVDVKQTLNAGEQRRVFSRMMNDITPGQDFTLKPEAVGKTKLIEYLIGWSFVDAEGKPVPVSEAAIDNLDPETFAEVSQAIEMHETTEREKREDERKNHTGATGSKATSASVAP